MLALHTITNKPWPARVCVERYASAGVRGITFWLRDFEEESPAALGRAARDAGLEVVSLARGGFFCAASTLRRQTLINDNLKAIDQCAELGAPSLVLVCGADPAQSLEVSRGQITAGIGYLLPHAEKAGVKLAIEPLHPMYADERSALNTLKGANAVCDALGSPPHLGLAVDLYHTWWDPELAEQIAIAGEKGRLFGFHLCDWKTPTTDILNDRGNIGEGCIEIAGIRRRMRAAGFAGYDEVEIFSNRHWARDQDVFLGEIVAAYDSLEP